MSADAARIARDHDDARRGSPPRLLIADDDLFVQSTLCAQLENEFEVVGLAANADQAIELAERHQPDVAIIDIEMPGGGGLRATLEIRERAPRTAIVALSSGKGASTVLDMLKAGAIAYLRKDRTSSELSRILRSSIAAHAQALAHGATDTTGGQS